MMRFKLAVLGHCSDQVFVEKYFFAKYLRFYTSTKNFIKIRPKMSKRQPIKKKNFFLPITPLNLLCNRSVSDSLKFGDSYIAFPSYVSLLICNVNPITIFRRPLWLTFHNPLVEGSTGGKLLPAKRSQVEKKEIRENLRKHSFSDHHLA